MTQFTAGSMVIGQVVMVLLMVITPLYMDRSGHGTQTISLIIMTHTIGMFAFSGVTGWLIDKVGRKQVIAAGAVIFIAASRVALIGRDIPIRVCPLPLRPWFELLLHRRLIFTNQPIEFE